MSWNWTDYDDGMIEFDEKANEIDRLARKLATAAGKDWDRMPNHPAYQKNQWREAARLALA